MLKINTNTLLRSDNCFAYKNNVSSLCHMHYLKKNNQLVFMFPHILKDHMNFYKEKYKRLINNNNKS
jgi:hypothetical protein